MSGSRTSRRCAGAVALVATAVIGLAGSANATQPGSNGLIAFSANGSSDPTQNGLLAMNPDGAGVHQIDAATSPDRQPAWSPDGQRVAFSADRTGSGDIYVVGADGTGLTQLTNDPEHDEWPTWSPDGSKIAFRSSRTGNSTIWVMDANGDNQTLLSPLDSNYDEPAWSPDGTKIAVRSDRSGASHIWVMNSDGTGLQDVTPAGPANSGYPSWAPDGTKIAFAGQSDVFVVNADGSGTPTNITNSSSLIEQRPSWSPDGRKIVYARYNPFAAYAGDIYVSNADGSGATKVTNIPGGYAGSSVFEPAWQTLPVLPTLDSDGDGVVDSIDTGIGAFTDSSLTPPTFGSITDAAGNTVLVDDAPTPDGVRITVTGTGTSQSVFSVCGFATLRLAPGADVVVTCGSVKVKVTSGSAQIVLDSGITVVTIPQGDTAKVTDLGNGSFTVANLAGPSAVYVLTSGTTSTVAAGGTSTIAVLTPANLCLLTKSYVQGSAKYAALTAKQKQSLDTKAQAACDQIAQITPRLTAKQKASLVANFTILVDALSSQGWLTPSEAATLKSLASKL